MDDRPAADRPGAGRHSDGAQTLASRRELFRSAFQRDLFVRRVLHFYPDEPVTEANAIQMYGTKPALRRISPNLLLDETWYRAGNPDVEGAIGDGRIYSGFHHFVFWGWRQGRFPNPIMSAQVTDRPLPALARTSFDPESYLRGSAEARLFLQHFPFVSAFAFFDIYGRRIDRLHDVPPSIQQLLEAEFDADFYRATYLADEPERVVAQPFFHYLYVGRRQGHSPNRWFDEGWYLAFYGDVRAAVLRGELMSGFHHYLLAGMREGRSPTYALDRALEIALPGVTRPELMNRTREIERRIEPIPVSVVSDAPRTLWLVLPRLNPDIAFGGYRALFALAAEMKRHIAATGMRLAIITTEEAQSNGPYFAWRMRRDECGSLLTDVEVRARAEVGRMAIGPRDRFLAYSTWDALVAQPMAAQTDEARILALVQEYEPLFCDHSALYALSASGLDVPSYPIFNSALLRDYFRMRRLGIFRGGNRPVEGRDYAVFEHVINVLPRPDAVELAAREERILAFYARPEPHASRNLYEIAELALRRLCQDGAFDRRWRFFGLGCLAELPDVDLGGGHRLEFVRKMQEGDYVRFMRSLDIGLSLMFAPHPSLMPYEFATTGALVVTNTFENRNRRYFERICRNFEPCRPTIEGVAESLRNALARVEDFSARVAAAYRPPPRTWAETFDEGFFRRTIAPMLR